MIKVLIALLDANQARVEPYGLELARQTGLKGGTLYPILDRLEAARWVEARWEDLETSAARRPRRCFYSLTSNGVAEARQVLAEHGVGAFRWV